MADDVGGDFFCTLFEQTGDSGSPALIPRTGFVVQVKSRGEIKSRGDRISLSKQLAFLHELGTPYFVGVVDTKALTLDLYSGRFLPLFFALKGKPRQVGARLIRRMPSTADGVRRTVRGGEKRASLDMPFLLTLTASGKVARHSATMFRECSLTTLNVHLRSTGQFVFQYPRNLRAIVAGSGSAQIFRDSFADRIAEYARNLLWLRANRQTGFANDEAEGLLLAYQNLRAWLPRRRHLARAINELSGVV